MHRLIVALLAAVDAAIAAAVGLAATLAPLTLLWVFGMGGGSDWKALWPAGAAIWQLGNLVPLHVTLPASYLVATGIAPDAATFTVSLAPLAFASFTATFAARSGARASHADAWLTGALTGSAVFAALTTLVALTSRNEIAGATLWQAILFPSLLFAVPALGAAAITEWREAGRGFIARLRDRVEPWPRGWGAAPGLIVRGTAAVMAGVVGLGALVTAAALILRGGDIIALYETAHVDVVGGIVVTLAQLAYLPTLVVWGISFVAGPGFALGADTTVSPAGTQVGVVPGIPILGVIPDSTTSWLLLLALGPVAVGAFAGWIARSRLLRVDAPGEPPAAGDANPVLRGDHEPVGARIVIALGIAVLSAGGAALLALAASGSIGPGRLAVLGPSPGPVALAVGVEVLVGAGILLLSPRGHREKRDSPSLPVVETDAAPSPPEQAKAEPEPFVYPTLPRIPGVLPDQREARGNAPVD
jgi:hypothetical protein